MSITFPIKYIAIAEYNPISILPKKITFNTTMPKSMIVIKFPVLNVGLYSFTKRPAKSDPPVDECALSINAVPIPC